MTRNEASIEGIASRWARLGAMFNVEPSARTPDLERLLLDTVRTSPRNVRLFIMADTWLTRFGDYVAKHRLARLIETELEAEHRPAMELLLEGVCARCPQDRHRFNRAIRACGHGASPARPLLDIDRGNATAVRLAERQASALSRKWGRWLAEFEPKYDALCPGEWVRGRTRAGRAGVDRGRSGGVDHRRVRAGRHDVSQRGRSGPALRRIAPGDPRGHRQTRPGRLCTAYQEGKRERHPGGDGWVGGTLPSGKRRRDLRVGRKRLLTSDLLLARAYDGSGGCFSRKVNLTPFAFQGH